MRVPGDIWSLKHASESCSKVVVHASSWRTWLPGLLVDGSSFRFWFPRSRVSGRFVRHPWVPTHRTRRPWQFIRRPDGLTWSQHGCNPGCHADADLANIPTRSQTLTEIRFQMKCDEVASRRPGLILGTNTPGHQGLRPCLSSLCSLVYTQPSLYTGRDSRPADTGATPFVSADLTPGLHLPSGSYIASVGTQ